MEVPGRGRLPLHPPPLSQHGNTLRFGSFRPYSPQWVHDELFLEQSADEDPQVRMECREVRMSSLLYKCVFCGSLRGRRLILSFMPTTK